jgi:WD40 repeat protein
VVLSPDGEWLVVEAGLSPRHALVGLRRDSESEFRPAWEVEVGRPPEHLGGFFGTGDRFVAVGHGQVVVRDAATGAVKSATRYPSAYIGHRAVSPDGSRFAVMGYGNLYVWDTAKWGKPKRVEGHSSRPYTSFAFHPTKPLLITVQRNQTLVKFLDTTTWKPVAKFQWKLGEITSVAFSPDGTLAAAGSSDGKIVVWDVDA